MFIKLWGTIRELLEVVWEIGGLFWEGKFVEGLTIWFTKALPLIGSIFIQVASIIVKTLYSIATAIVATLSDRLYKILGKLKFWSSGGVHPGGLAVVGERGPELVNMPKGTKVHSNAQSKQMGMGGNTINVHVNGRVGANDAEIRDIAQKVARQINLEMNRGQKSIMGA